MDPIFAVMLDVMRLVTFQPRDIKQTWPADERPVRLYKISQDQVETSRDQGSIAGDQPRAIKA